jgi:hypothetical protein
MAARPTGPRPKKDADADAAAEVPAEADAADVAPRQPEAFAIPTDLLVETLRLIGSLPAQQASTVFLRLQQLRPLE